MEINEPYVKKKNNLYIYGGGGITRQIIKTHTHELHVKKKK